VNVLVLRSARVADADQELVDRFRAGERRAFDELVRRHERAILRVIARYVRDAEEARDLAQRAFVQAFQRIDTFRGDAAFRTWVYRIAVNLALSYVRRPRLVIAPLVDQPSEEDTRPDGDTRRQLRAAVATLPPKQRLTVELRVFEDLSFREVGEIVGCSEDAAKMNFHHAVKKLRVKLIGERSE
jgi:RNA polymerase sigma-70 factor (ECF subfamily)